MNIAEAPSDEVAAKLAINLSARGTVQTLTLTAMVVDDLIVTLKKKPGSTQWWFFSLKGLYCLRHGQQIGLM